MSNDPENTAAAGAANTGHSAPQHRVIHWDKVDFSSGNSTSVVSGAMKYILPVPEDNGEALVYPETVTDVKGQVHAKGAPITDYKGTPLEGSGVVVYNSSEKIYQAGVGGKTGDARSVIIINHVTEEKAARLDQLVNSLTGNHPENLTFEQFKQVEQFARTELGLTNMYDSNVKFVKGNMQDPFTGKGGDEVSPVGFKKRDARDRVQAVFVEGPAELHRPDGTPLPIGEEGAVVLKQGDGVRVITKADFEATYRSAEGFQPIAPDAVKRAIIVNTPDTAIPAGATIRVEEPAATTTKPSSSSPDAAETPAARIKEVNGDIRPTGHIADEPIHNQHTSAVIPASLSATSKAAIGAHVAAGAVGIGLGTVGLINSIEQGDTPGIIIAGSNVATGAGQSTIAVLGAAGKHISPALQGGLAKANILVTVADGAYQVYKEDGAEHKLQRAAAVAATTGAGMVTGAVLTGGLTIGGVAATGAAATATALAAPVILAAGAAVVVGVAADTIIDTTRSYENVDNAFKPSKDYRNVISMQLRLAKRMDELGATKNKDGVVDLTNSANVEKMSQAIEEKKTELKDFMDKNEPWTPRWIQFTEAQGKKRGAFESAKQEYRIFDSASQELPEYLAEIKTFEQKKAQEAAMKEGVSGNVKNTLPSQSADAHDKVPIMTAVPSQQDSGLRK